MAAAHSAVERTGNQLPARHQMDCEGLSKQLPLDGAVESQVFSDIHWALIVLLDWPKWSEFQMVLQAPLLRTKLHRPPVTTDLVHRERLHQRLNQGLELPLTLVSAPAGYGKSMLVSHWTQSLDHPCAWLSLDETDSDLTEFLIYMVAAVRTAVPGACPETEELLTAAVLPPVHVLAHRLANELDELGPTLVLVLDDYQCIAASSPVHELIGHLLQHPPQPLRLVLISRRDPPLPLVSLRAAHRIAEVTLGDLRFASPEMAEFLETTAGHAASDSALANLQHEVEGWAVGLRLVSLALRNVKDREAFLKDLHGGLPQTQDYLLDEVLNAQPSAVRETLLKSSILNRFSGDILDAICPSEDATESSVLSGDALVDLLERSNLFAIPLDASDQWFRYHHLFRDLLQRELRKRCSPAEIAALHLRASDWFESEGLVSEAIEHALAAKDEERAADIIERHGYDEVSAERWNVVERWLAQLPTEVKKERAELLLTEGWIAGSSFQLGRLASLVEQAESLLQGREVEPTQRGELAYFKGFLQYWAGEAEASRRSLLEAVSLLEGDRPFFAYNAEVMLGLARYMAGEKALAIQALQDQLQTIDAQEGQLRAYLIADLAFIHLIAGDLADARAEAERLERVARKSRLPNSGAWGSYVKGCTHLHANELDAAARDLGEASDLRYVLDTRASVDAMSGLALTHQLGGRDVQASAALEVVLEFARETNDSLILSVAQSARARVSLLRGDLPSALDWAQSFRETPLPMELFFWLEVPSITRARVLIALGSEQSLGQATELLQELWESSISLRLASQTIEISVLQALAIEKQGRTEEALDSVKEAVALARPGGWIRPFVEAGPTMASMLERLDARADEEIFVRQILTAFAKRDAAPPAERAPASAPAPLSRLDRQAVQSLTNREIDVLELLAQRLQNKEIATQLSISPHTVHDHTRRIYDKLGVNGRRQAVKRAVKLGVVDARFGLA